MLRLPAEPADAPSSGGDVIDQRGAAAHAILVAIAGILQGRDRLVGDRFDEAGAEERNRRAPRDDRRGLRNVRLTSVSRNREEVHQRLAGLIERPEVAFLVDGRGPGLEDRAGAADGRHVVTDGAAGAVERRSKAFFGRLDFREVVEAEAELRELPRAQPGEGIAGAVDATLPVHQRDPYQRDSTRRDRRDSSRVDHRESPVAALSVFTTITPRMNEWPAPHICVHSNS